MIKTKLTRGPFNVKGAGGIVIVKVLDHETFIGLPRTQQNCKKIFYQLSVFQQKQPSPVRPSARVHSRNSLSLESKSSWLVQIQSWNQSADPITKSTYSKKIFFLWEKNQTKNVILVDAGHHWPRDQRMPPCAGGVHQLQGFIH